MEQFIMENPTLFEIQDYKNFLQVGFITQSEYNELMENYGPQPSTPNANKPLQNNQSNATK